jgi:hypothetical protein
MQPAAGQTSSVPATPDSPKQAQRQVADPPSPSQSPESATVAADSVSFLDFHAYLPAHQYIFAPTRELWPSASVNARVTVPQELGPHGKPLKPSQWLDLYRPLSK